MRSLTCFCLVVLVLAEARISGRSGGGSRSSGSRGWGGSSSSSSGYGSRTSGSSSSWGSSGQSSGFSSSGSNYKPISHGSGSSGSTNYGWRSSVTNPKPSISGTHHQTSHILPLSTGSRSSPKPTSRPQVYNRNTPRPITQPKPLHNNLQQSGKTKHNTTGGGGFIKSNNKIQQQHATNSHSSKMNNTGGFYKPSAPPLLTPSAPPAPPVAGLDPHAPSAPPAPGWKPGAPNDAMQKQHVTNNQNIYPGQYPNQPSPPYGPYGSSHYPNQPPPPYSNQPPPPYGSPYGSGHYPNQPPPPYPGTNMHYPNQPPPAYYPQTGGHYPVQQGPVYYPAPPPPPPGYSPYGMPYYKDRSGIRGSDVVAGLALWELMRHNHHHNGFGVQHVHHYHDGPNYGNNYADNYNNYQPTYHDTMRERYTTRVTPNPTNNAGSGAYNILEMTHYITPDDKGEIYTTEGNMTCISVYNARSVTNLHQKQVEDFHKNFPNYTYPLYLPENDTMAKEFTITPGRVIHREPISITCCGTDKGKVDLNLLTNGKHPNVNCLNTIGHIPIKKLTFIKTAAVVTKPTGEWHPVEVFDSNNTTSAPLAAFPPNWNATISSTPTPLASFPNNITITIPVPLAPFPTSMNTTTASSVDLSQTFEPPKLANKTEIDLNQVFNLNSTSSTESTVGVTNNPSDLIIE